MLVPFLLLAAAAVELTLDRLAIERALAIGQSRVERDHQQFHQPYRLIVNLPPVDYIDIVTPFRRIVLEAEQRLRTGDRSFGQRQALEVAALTPDQVDFLIELTFHPLNAYVGVPGYELELRPASGPAIRPLTYVRVPRFGPRVDGTPPPAPGLILPGASQPMLGGTVIASVDGRLLSPTAIYEVVVMENGKEIAATRVSLGAVR